MLDFFEDDQDLELDPSQNLVHHSQQVWGEVRMHASVSYATLSLVMCHFYGEYAVWMMVCCLQGICTICVFAGCMLCALTQQFVSVLCLVSLL